MSELPPAPALYRMHLKTAGERAEVERACLQGGLLGLGWGYGWGSRPPPRTITWERYIGWAEGRWPGGMSSVRSLHDAEGLVWTRTADGVYYLAKLTGEWEYRAGEPYDGLDLNNIRTARIEQIGSEIDVPGALIRRFSRQGHAFCRVWDDSTARYSALIWARETGESYEWRPCMDEVLDTLLSPFDVQDLVAAYLQAERGWLLFPSRLSDSTAAYEYVLRDPRSSKSYAVQVKTGEAPIELGELARADALAGWVVFSTTEAYRGAHDARVEKLDRGELLRFMLKRRSTLPPVIASWLDAARPSPDGA